MSYFWFCSISPQGRRSRVAHAVKSGKALCNTQVAHGTRSYATPEGAGAKACKRCQKAMASLTASLSPKSVTLRKLTRMSDSFYALDVDGQLYYFDYKWWCGKFASDPDDFGVGVKVPAEALTIYDVRAIPDAPTIHLTGAWQPC